MGLDMYLNAKRFLWHGEDAIAEKITELFDELDDARIKEVTAELLYWRKANAIHKWFVDNCQEGRDECQETYVSREQLEKLLEVIKEVLADRKKAPLLLPPQAGFFFGSDQIDSWYWEDLKSTKEKLEKVLSQNFKNWDFYYRASW